MNGKILLGTTSLFLLFLLFPLAEAQCDDIPDNIVWEKRCHNSTHLYRIGNYYHNGSYCQLNQTYIDCLYQCDTGKNECNPWYGDAIPSEYFLLFEIFALIMLVLSIKSISNSEKESTNIFYSGIAMVLFFILGLQSANIVSLLGEHSNLIFVTWFNYGLALLSLAVFFITIFFIAGVYAEEGG